jgi:beta-galactosidase
LPAEFSERVVELCFGAIAKIADVWMNGQHVGSHVGMFGEVRCDVTHAVKPGRNVLAVLARGGSDKQANPHDVVGVAVTVEVTEAMLHSLPHGMYPEEAAGIWQPVTLTVTRTVAVKDVFLQPRLDGLSFELELRNAAERQDAVTVDYLIRDARDGSLFYAAPRSEPKSVGAEGMHQHYSTPELKPKLWSPHEPNLYNLEIRVHARGELVDRHIARFGFRTFAVAGNRFLLNGKPFWLRGANHFPHALRPNDGELARRFMQLAREGNVLATRSHTAPFTDTWLNAADEVGMAVSYEGTWPWLMLEGDLPEPDLLHVWKAEFASLLRRHRNHPSIVMWTVNNEMKFEFMDSKSRSC